METRHRLEQGLEGRYAIERLLGEGGMAQVYLAQDLKHHRRVAIKVLRPEISAALGTERFLREIEVAAGLNHPNILALHDSGEADGLLYFVMPFVEGESLRARLDREGRLPLSEALRIAEEIGNALDYAHERGLVHRDIKPENILFQAGHAMVADLGIAQVATGDDERLTRTGVAVGTFTYMSPEQLAGGRTIDGRSDVYSLACVVHEMLSGTNPFEASTAQASLAKRLTGEVADVARGRSDLPPTLQPVLERALTVEAEERFPTAGMFVQGLRASTTQVAVEAEGRRRRRQAARRNAAVGVGILSVGFVAWIVSRALAGPTMGRIAVLPFQNAQPDSTEQYFVDGAWADLVFELSDAVRGKAVGVIGTASAARVAATGLSVQEIAEDLRVDGVISGRMDIDADSVRFDLELVDPRTRESVWTGRFGSDTRDIVSLYREIARAIAEGIGVPLEQEDLTRLARDEPVDPQVYQALLQARFNWLKLTAEGINNAEDYYHQAVRLSDSTSAEAWYGLATVWGMRAQMGLAEGRAALDRGAEYRARAEAIEPSFSVMGAGARAWFEWDFEGAVHGFKAEFGENPTDAVTEAYLALAQYWLGQEEDEADLHMRQAVERDPFNSRVLALYGQYLNFKRRYEDAVEVFSQVLRREPNDPIALSNLRGSYHHLGRYQEAMPIWREYYRSGGDTAAVRALDEGYAAGGYPAALRAVARLFEERGDPAKLWQIATLYTRAGDEEKALDFMERSAEVMDPNTPYITVDPLFDRLRDEPRFQALVDRILEGLPPSVR